MLRVVKRALILAGRALPSSMRHSLFHYAYNCAPEEFERFSFFYGNSARHTLEQVALRGFSPRTIVDVGAYEGAWSKMVSSIWPEAHIVMIEGNREKNTILSDVAADLRGTVYLELLGEEEGKEVKFHVMETGSSILPEERDVPRERNPGVYERWTGFWMLILQRTC
jgi:hypothetical protein